MLRPKAFAPAMLYVLSFTVGTPAIAGPSEYWITKSDIELLVPGNLGAPLVPGVGVDMSDPDRPVVATYTAFKSSSGQQAKALLSTDLPAQAVTTATATFIEADDARTEAEILSAYFSASYGLNSVDAAYKRVTEDTRSRKTVYALITSQGDARALDDTEIRWSQPIAAERLPDNERLAQFVRDFGSHYIKNIEYGMRIAVQGTIYSADSSDQINFSASFKANIGAVAAGGAISQQFRTLISSKQIEINSSITAGGITPNRPVVLTNIDQINAFLEDLRQGKITVRPAPLKAYLKSYWNTLPPSQYPKLRADLRGASPSIIGSDAFGVPRGTVIAWKPGKGNLTPDKKPLLPDGWTTCDGSHDTFNLTGLFIRGTTDFTKSGLTGGSETHTHTATSGQGARKAIQRGSGEDAADAYHTHPIAVNPANNLPPFVNMILLCKL
jgi:hypothetical protein